jgi:hypothetical protein
MSLLWVKEENRCSNCRFRDFHVGVCCLEDSPRHGDYTFMVDTCEKWELIGSV